MSKEAMKLALEALIGARAFLESDAPVEIWGVNDKAITALREALAEQPAQQEPVATLWQHSETGRTRITMPGDITDCDARWFKAADLYTSPPAQRKPLTDDPLQGAVDWLLEADGKYFCTATVQRTLRIGYNRAKRLCDTAKERAAHDIKEGS